MKAPFWRKRFLLGSALVTVALSGCGPRAGWTIQPSGRLTEPDLNESSGLAASRRHAGVYWTHNDDGEPEVFAIDRTGKVLARYQLSPARNVDWEEIALDEENNLYVLDNTSRVFENRASTVYVFPEPDLKELRATITPSRVLEFPFSGGGADFEAMFCWKGFIYFIDKPWTTRHPTLYRASLANPGPPDVIGPIPVLGLITAADINRSGQRIALTSYRGLFVFEGTGDPAEILMGQPLVSPLNARQVEAVTWQGDDLILSNEERDIFRIPRVQWRKKEAPFYRSAKKGIPRLPQVPRASQRLEEWPAGQWLRASGPQGEVLIGRVAWSQQGLHIGIRLPERVRLEALDPGASEGFIDWFRPGRVYVMINPSGTRPLTFEPEDRCVVIGRGRNGELQSEARQLGPGTMVEKTDDHPSWVQLEEDQGRLLVTLTRETPGLGGLQADRQLGFNLLIVAADGVVLSWTPLTLRFSWDCPSHWGLVETKG